jgi:hypothetical protein
MGDNPILGGPERIGQGFHFTANALYSFAGLAGEARPPKESTKGYPDLERSRRPAKRQTGAKRAPAGFC